MTTKILVFSDSHGQPANLLRVLRMHGKDVQTVVHLGDGPRDLLQYQAEFPALDMVHVAGNSDYSIDAPRERILTVDSTWRFLLLHGHYQNVKSGLDRLMYYAQEKGVDACLFGHTHIPTVFSHESVFFMNPGSISKPWMTRTPSYGLVSISSDGEISSEVLYI